jgi:hypothetical protein
MLIDEKLMKQLKPGFEYLEEYDKYGQKPNKRVVLSVTIPLKLKKRLEKTKNISRFVEKAIEDEMKKQDH